MSLKATGSGNYESPCIYKMTSGELLPWPSVPVLCCCWSIVTMCVSMPVCVSVLRYCYPPQCSDVSCLLWLSVCVCVSICLCVCVKILLSTPVLWRLLSTASPKLQWCQLCHPVSHWLPVTRQQPITCHQPRCPFILPVISALCFVIGSCPTMAAGQSG